MPVYFILPGCMCLRMPGSDKAQLLGEERDVPGETEAEREMRLDLAKRHDRTGTSSVLAVMGMLTDIDVVLRPRSSVSDGRVSFSEISEVFRDRVNSLVAPPSLGGKVKRGSRWGVSETPEGVGGRPRANTTVHDKAPKVAALERDMMSKELAKSVRHVTKTCVLCIPYPSPPRPVQTRTERSNSVANGVLSVRLHDVSVDGDDRAEAEAEAEGQSDPTLTVCVNRALTAEGSGASVEVEGSDGVADTYPLRINPLGVVLIGVGCLNGGLKLRTFF
ncbi:hypothetical protein KIPB_011165 [Kipferlia bialata]|uniref:Uncharacterized protein n=1 Tax=Kipferlia bialata TaxID=797122 RepID=A0A9K3D745_9EUKA|nr:hypothetical protein KIPB_011165 [Kipferlia bialata]|eukprot:g11165.t1